MKIIGLTILLLFTITAITAKQNTKKEKIKEYIKMVLQDDPAAYLPSSPPKIEQPLPSPPEEQPPSTGEPLSETEKFVESLKDLQDIESSNSLLSQQQQRPPSGKQPTNPWLRSYTRFKQPLSPLNPRPNPLYTRPPFSPYTRFKQALSPLKPRRNPLYTRSPYPTLYDPLFLSQPARRTLMFGSLHSPFSTLPSLSRKTLFTSPSVLFRPSQFPQPFVQEQRKEKDEPKKEEGKSDRNVMSRSVSAKGTRERKMAMLMKTLLKTETN